MLSAGTNIFASLAWQPEGPFSKRAILNNKYFVIRFTIGASPAYYNVFQNNVGMPQNLGLPENIFKERLNAGWYEEANAPVVNPPANPVNPVQPVVDPSVPEGSGDNTFTYWLVAGALFGVVYFFKKKKK